MAPSGALATTGSWAETWVGTGSCTEDNDDMISSGVEKEGVGSSTVTAPLAAIPRARCFLNHRLDRGENYLDRRLLRLHHIRAQSLLLQSLHHRHRVHLAQLLLRRPLYHLFPVTLFTLCVLYTGSSFLYVSLNSSIHTHIRSIRRSAHLLNNPTSLTLPPLFPRSIHWPAPPSPTPFSSTARFSGTHRTIALEGLFTRLER